MVTPLLNAQIARFSGSKGSGTDRGRTTISGVAAFGGGGLVGTDGALWATESSTKPQASAVDKTVIGMFEDMVLFRGRRFDYLRFAAMRASSSSPRGAECLTRKLSAHSRAKSRWRRQLLAPVTLLEISAPRLAMAMSLCESQTSPFVPR